MKGRILSLLVLALLPSGPMKAKAGCLQCGDQFPVTIYSNYDIFMGWGGTERWIQCDGMATDPGHFTSPQSIWINDQETVLHRLDNSEWPEQDEAELQGRKDLEIQVNSENPRFDVKFSGTSSGTIYQAWQEVRLEWPICYNAIEINGERLELDGRTSVQIGPEHESIFYSIMSFNDKVICYINQYWADDVFPDYIAFPSESTFTIEFLAFKNSQNDKPGSCGSGGSGSSPSSPGLSAGSPESSGGGSASVPAPSISYAFGLGKIDAETSAGKLQIAADTLTSASFTPEILSYEEKDGVEKILDGSGNIRQIYAPDTLANVVTTDSDTFEIKFYATTGSESVDGSGYYIPVGSPLVTWKVDKVTSSKMEVTKTEGALVDSSTMEKITGGWKVTSQDGDRVEQLTWVDTSSGGVNQLRRTRIVEDHRGMSAVTVSKVITDYEEFTWDWEVVVETEDPDGANRVTEWTYYDEAVLTGLSVPDPEEDPRFGKEYTRQSPDGSWVKYLAYDESGGAIETLEGWKDITLSSGTTSNARWTVKSDITDGTKTEIYLEGHLAKRSDQLTIFDTATEKTAREYSASGNYLETVTRIGSDGRTESVSYPDGRRDSYVFEKGNWNNSTSTFTADSEGLAKRKTVKHGTESAVDGVANKSTWDRTVTDAGGNTVLRETFVYTGSGTSLLTSVRSHYDADNQLTSQTSNGRTVLTQTWSDGKLQTSTDEQGIVTTYAYDAYGRTATETRTGLVTTYSYDIEGRLESQETGPES